VYFSRYHSNFTWIQWHYRSIYLPSGAYVGQPWLGLIDSNVENASFKRVMQSI